MFRVNKRSLFFTIVFMFVVFFIVTAKLPYYIYKPGSADELSPMVDVDLGYPSHGGFHLVTVSGGQATPIEYLFAKISSYHELLPIDEALPEGFTDEEFRHYQLKMMEHSKLASKVVAYKAAGESIEVKSRGVYVIQTIEGMPAEQMVEVGDRLLAVDHIEIVEPDDLITYVETKKLGDEVTLQLERDNEQLEVSLAVSPFPEKDEKKGLGIQLMAEQSAHVARNVDISSGNIGGPSAGLMFALEIYNQLVKEDMTKGYKIAGTGEVDLEGNVLRVGGVDKKVIAAHRKGMEIFFVPYEEGAEDSNYKEAKETAIAIKTEMKIVPIDSFDEALHYLNQLERQ